MDKNTGIKCGVCNKEIKIGDVINIKKNALANLAPELLEACKNAQATIGHMIERMSADDWAVSDSKMISELSVVINQAERSI